MSKHGKTSCEATAELIGLYASGDLSPPESTEIGEHLLSCVDCRERFNELQRIAGSLAGGAPAWLEAAGESVIKRVSAELGLETLNHSRDQQTVAGIPSRAKRSGLLQKRLDRHGWSWLMISVMAAGLLWIAMSGWLMDWWTSAPEQSVAPERVVEASPSPEQGVLEITDKAPVEFPTWWEMQRSLAESDEALELILARGRSGAHSQPLNLNRLVEELTQ